MEIRIENVSKSFRHNQVLTNINMNLTSGHIYGFQGRNGSGKTVLLKLLCGFFKPSQGQIFYNDNLLNNDVYKYNVGALIENPKFFSDLSGYKNLKNLAEIQNKIGKKEIDEILEFLRLTEDKDKLYCKYSLGMKQKLGIAQAIMENPDIIFLDEPFSGIEEEIVQKLKKYLLKQKKKGKLIIISSHIKEDLDDLCDQIFSFDLGKVKELKR